jgi:hypothetical protein
MGSMGLLISGAVVCSILAFSRESWVLRVRWLNPVATHADPGFGGNLGIVTQNLSDKFIELPQGEPIR